MAKKAKGGDKGGRGGKGKQPITADRIREIADTLARKSKRLRELAVIMQSRELAAINVKGEWSTIRRSPRPLITIDPSARTSIIRIATLLPQKTYSNLRPPATVLAVIPR